MGTYSVQGPSSDRPIHLFPFFFFFLTAEFRHSMITAYVSGHFGNVVLIHVIRVDDSNCIGERGEKN